VHLFMGAAMSDILTYENNYFVEIKQSAKTTRGFALHQVCGNGGTEDGLQYLKNVSLDLLSTYLCLLSSRDKLCTPIASSPLHQLNTRLHIPLCSLEK